jgi:hypothetical protein
MKYRRLLRLVLLLAFFSAGWGYVLGYLWDYGLSPEGLTKQLLVMRGLNALKNGVIVGGLCIGFPVWLVLENFRRPETFEKP